MPIPAWPANLLPRPFANNGNAALVPDVKPSEGRASWQEGFPVETQLPLTNGGIAPSRIDFNGIFQMLSALAFWQQSGGQAVYSPLLNYAAPCIAYHEGRLWWCLKANGPDTTEPGVVAPGSDNKVWQDLWKFLSGQGGGGGGGSVTASGYILEFRSFYEQNPPTGWAIRNGQVLSAADTTYPDLWAALQLPENSWKLKSETAWQALRAAAGGAGGAPFFVLDAMARTIRLPDTRGDYERCAGAGTMADVGQWHQGAIKNIVGNFVVDPYVLSSTPEVNGAFVGTGHVGTVQSAVGANYDTYGIRFDASRVVETASENRTRAIGVLGCVYTGVAVS